MAEPADKTPYFVVVQTDVLPILKLLLNMPSRPNRPHHSLKGGAYRSAYQVIGLLGGIVGQAANQ